MLDVANITGRPKAYWCLGARNWEGKTFANGVVGILTGITCYKEGMEEWKLRKTVHLFSTCDHLSYLFGQEITTDIDHSLGSLIKPNHMKLSVETSSAPLK